MKQLLILFALCVLLLIDADAQCAMCKAVVGSDGASGGGFAAGINNGILYMIGTVYSMLIGGGIYLMRYLKKHPA